MNKKIINYLSLISFLIFLFFLSKAFSPNEMDSFWNYSSAINLDEYKSYFDLFLSMIFVLMEPLFRGIISLRADSISIIFTLFSLTLLKCRKFPY